MCSYVWLGGSRREIQKFDVFISQVAALCLSAASAVPSPPTFAEECATTAVLSLSLSNFQSMLFM